MIVLINGVGFLLFGVGLLITVPLSACATAVAYQDVMGLSNTGMADEATGLSDSF
ncbi:MAG: hypothetical protein Fur0046_06910 [Cyanobacteria bacterium J069]